MKITQSFVAQSERYGFSPSDFIMVEMGWFHAYCRKIDNAAQKTGRIETRHMIPISRFERLTALPQFSKDVPEDRHEFVINKLVNIYTPQENRDQPKQARNMEVFLNSCPPGSTLIRYWERDEQRSQNDVIIGRVALSEVNDQITGWAYEFLTPDSFGMCFRDEVDALLFAGVLPAVREEVSDNWKDKKLWNRKQPW